MAQLEASSAVLLCLRTATPFECVDAGEVRKLSRGVYVDVVQPQRRWKRKRGRRNRRRRAFAAAKRDSDSDSSMVVSSAASSAAEGNSAEEESFGGEFY